MYDGLKPLYLDSVLQTNKGMHISLAALYCAVGRRLNVTLIPEIAPLAGTPHACSLSRIQSAITAILLGWATKILLKNGYKRQCNESNPDKCKHNNT